MTVNKRTLNPSSRPKRCRLSSSGEPFSFLADAAMERLEKHLKEVRSAGGNTGFVSSSEREPLTEDHLVGCVKILEDEKDHLIHELLSDIAGCSTFPAVREAARAILKKTYG